MTDPALLSATQAMAGMAAGRFSAQDLAAACLDRIAALNPVLNAIVALRPRDQIMAEARAADAARAAGGPLGALHGLPMAIKDLAATRGLVTTWGSPIYRDHIPARDDLMVARIRAAGAIIIGKTNTPEFGLGSHSFNEVYGTTLNPWDRARSAGGSSGGAAVALSARMLPLADGSDMMGSLRNPAAWNAVYGFRPSWGLVPTDGPGDRFMATLATNGPMGRSLRDLALLLDVIAGPDPATPFGRPADDFRAAPDAAPPRVLRIGWLGDWGGAYATEPGILPLCQAALTRMQDELGAEIIPLPPPFPAAQLWQSWTGLRAFLNATGRRALADDPALWAQLKPEMQWEIEQGRHLTLEALHQASLIRTQWYQRLARLFTQVDLIALPSAQVWPFPADWRWPQQIGDRPMDTYHRWMEVVVPASLAGLPTLSVPVGFGGPANRLPMGMQIAGPVGADARVLSLGQRWNRIEDYSLRLPPAA
ncbi:MAG: amidase [Paracoccus sp. (in: a-proteobacteria)]|uniref:amidase n=1 Tax=Paracoccus sp. TaxID=267 RepID=UPI0026DF4918|nr:amidase [Paracoccus sp. (in: a-proteobacteria)]MDO5612564.1 amidase [Paracoccus sp. (in: a-proteobacteria)]